MILRSAPEQPTARILEQLPAIQARIDREWGDAIRRVTIFFSGEKGPVQFRCGGELLILHIGDRPGGEWKESVFPEPEEIGLAPFPLRNVGLYFPRKKGDSRWDSIALPASSLFLGSALRRAGFQVRVRPLDLPGDGRSIEADGDDLLGFTLFEDLFEETREHLHGLREQFAGLIAAGGPLVTLAPLAAAYHLPQVNLLVRGEGELVLPPILRAIGDGNLEALLGFSGLFFQRGRLIVLSDFDRVNRVEDFGRFDFDLGFMTRPQFEKGLEVNLSRGCRRRCAFCSRVQGGALRKIPLDKIGKLLSGYEKKLTEFEIDTPDARTININDDDILQDPAFAGEVMKLVRKNGFSLWGIQTSIQSLIDRRGKSDGQALEILGNPEFFFQKRPLVWLGTDTFLTARGKRLGKEIPPVSQIEKLAGEFEKRGIRHFHYWIASDFDSTWSEFIAEVLLILSFRKRFPGFGLLAHAPFLVPYPSTPVYRMIVGGGMTNQLRLKKVLPSARPEFAYPLVSAVETRFPNLNRLLRNEPDPASGRGGFFDFLKAGDNFFALRLIHHFLRQERLESESAGQNDFSSLLRAEEAKLEDVLSRMSSRSS